MKALSLRKYPFFFFFFFFFGGGGGGDKMVCLDNFVEFFIFNFVIGHNRKFPSGLTETHDVDLHLNGL